MPKRKWVILKLRWEGQCPTKRHCGIKDLERKNPFYSLQWFCFQALRFLPTIPLPGGGISQMIGECVEQEN